MNRIFKILLWVAVSPLGVVSVLVPALQRGEPVSALWLVVAGVCAFAVSYRFYSAWLMAKVLVLDRGAGFSQLPVDFSREDAGLGLAGLADRVESLGGHIRFANRSDGPGAVLRMTLDVKEAL